MIKDCLRPGVTLDIIKATEGHIGEDSSFTFYPLHPHAQNGGNAITWYFSDYV
jgi:hypothetical protein